MHSLIDVSLLRLVANFFFTLSIPGEVLRRKNRENPQNKMFSFLLFYEFFDRCEHAETCGQFFITLGLPGVVLGRKNRENPQK